MDQNHGYNNLIIFDLDGVLVNSRELHYESLNRALEEIDRKYKITWEEHLSKYDGLPTRKKLEMLTVQKGLPREEHAKIADLKQQKTREIIWSWEADSQLIKIFYKLRSMDFKIAVASNSIRDTVKWMLLRLGLLELVDYYQSNEDVIKNKPYPEMYWNCMRALNAIPATTIIFEDSHIGRQAAIDSGAKLVPVKDATDLTWEKVMSGLESNGSTRKAVPWRDSKLNIVIPMAGAGSRFAASGYTFPKPLIEVHGKPMIQLVVENLNIEAKYIYIVQKEHYEKYNLKYLLNLITPNCDVVFVDGLTEGAACTTLLAKSKIDNDNHLLISNSDQFIEWNSNEVMYAFGADQIDGGILTFHNTHPKWSYARLDAQGFVAEVAEKKVISENATVGIYYWNKGSDYVKYAEQMINKNIRTNNEFYVAPVFNEAILDNKKIRVKEIQKMWGIGTPEDLNYFLENYKGPINGDRRIL